MILSSGILAKILLIFVNLLHKPKEGIFLRDRNNKDYCYWSLRAVVRKWPIWLARQIFLPFFELLILKMLGVRSSFTNSLYEGWIDCEFIELGKNVKIGQGSFITSNIIIQDKLILKKVTIKDNVIIGAHSIVLPGTIIEPNTILDTMSMTKINQELESNALYRGYPAKKVEREALLRDEIKLKEFVFESNKVKEYDEENLKAHTKELSVPIYFYLISGWIIIGGSFMIPGFLFFLFLFGILVPSLFSVNFSFNLLLDLKVITLLISIPIIFICLYLLHLYFVALFTRWFYRMADKRGPNQGVFDRNLDESSKALNYYHFRSFLFKYPISAVIRSPFPWLLNWELRFIGSNKVGRGTVFEETFFHSHINFGDNCYLGTAAHISNHLVDGVYGEENLTFFGAEIGNNCVFSLSNGAMPGLQMDDNSTVLPKTATVKYDRLGKNGIFGKFPAKKLTKEEIVELLGDDFNEQ